MYLKLIANYTNSYGIFPASFTIRQKALMKVCWLLHLPIKIQLKLYFANFMKNSFAFTTTHDEKTIYTVLKVIESTLYFEGYFFTNFTEDNKHISNCLNTLSPLEWRHIWTSRKINIFVKRSDVNIINLITTTLSINKFKNINA